MKAMTHTLVGSGLALFGFLANAEEAAKPIALDIKPQPMVDALNGWAQQTGFQIIWPDEESTSDLAAPRVKGRLTAQAALDKLLAGTSLTYEFVNDRTVAIHDQFPMLLPTRGSMSGKTLEHRFMRIAAAQVDEAGHSSGNSTAESAVAAADAREAENNNRQRRGVMEEVIVTAQKRAERLEDVPISITALSGDDLDRSFMEGVAEALNTVPGVATLEWRNGMGRQLAVRGVTAKEPWFSGSSPIGYYVDSVPFSFVRSAFAPDAGAYDLERVEVLRGSQGTLYGASSLNGVVRILTKEADLDEFGFKSRVLGSTTEEGSGNYRGDMAINAPLIEGKLAARLTAGREDLSGWIDRPNNKNANDARIDTVRLKLKAQPSERLTVDMSGWWYRSDYGAPNTGDDNHRHAAVFDEPNSTDYDVFGLKLDYEFQSFALTSSSSYMDYAGYTHLDFSPFCCAPFVARSDFTGNFFAQEILANSIVEGPWHWSLGAYYRNARDRTLQAQVGGAPVQGWDDTSESWAVFGEISRLLLDGRLELTAGLRYFEDRIGTETNVSPTGNDFFPSASDDFDSLTPRFVVTGHVNDDFLVYASYSEGFRSGLLQTAAAAAAGVPPAEPDTLKNYEIGTKVSLWNNRFDVDASVYYIDWEDAFVPGPLVFIPVDGELQPFGISYVNGPSRSGMGVDLAVTAYPTDGLTLGFNLSVNDLKSDEDWIVPDQGIIAAKDERLDGSPGETYGIFAEYEFPLGRSGFTGTLSTAANYVSEITATTTAPGGATLIVAESDTQLISRASFAVHAPRNWVATAFVNNLSNERGVSAPNTFGTPSWDARPRPRTYGVHIEYRY